MQACQGVVTDKVPQTGFVLFEPYTAEACRLFQAWMDPSKPRRLFFPHTCVWTAAQASIPVSEIFARQRGPVKVHIHQFARTGRELDGWAQAIRVCRTSFVSRSLDRLMLAHAERWRKARLDRARGRCCPG